MDKREYSALLIQGRNNSKNFTFPSWSFGNESQKHIKLKKQFKFLYEKTILSKPNGYQQLVPKLMPGNHSF
jgi:hypothetical protein